MKVMPIFPLLIATLFLAEPSYAAPANIPEVHQDIFTVVSVTKVDAEFALAKIRLQKPCLLLKQAVANIDSAAKMVNKSVNYVPIKRIGQYGEWIFFPRLDQAKDDLAFKSGFAIKVGTKELFHWEEK